MTERDSAPSGLAAPGSDVSTADIRRTIDGVECRFAYALPDDEIRDLLASLERPRDTSETTSVLGGRSSVWLHQIPAVGPAVIKEFRRGGMLQVFRRRHYMRSGTTRPDREFDALRLARVAGVNAPEAIASFVRGSRFYRGWLATRFIEGRNLVAVAAAQPELIPDLMAQVGWQVMLLIRHRIAHVDLHPGNVLVDGRNAPFLLDFDRAVMFEKSPEALREQYHVRWTWAVAKHGLPEMLSESFTRGLYDRPGCSLTCDNTACAACSAGGCPDRGREST
jgi:3-deoxy-D-manno-octulosonic acid kinase